jgi:leader peptidase (prepilin peptidase)/N-methyltransferase
VEREFFLSSAWVIFLFGLSVGSFLNVIIYRLPRRKSAIAGRSRCPACGRVLGWRDLFPLLSYLLLRGRCRYCRSPISPRYPAVELLTGAVFTALFYRYGLSPVLVKYFFLCSLLIAASFIDLEHYLIPDRLVFAGFLGGIPLGLLAGDVGIKSALLGAALAGGFFLLVVVISKGGMGGGDVKLAGMTGLFLGWPLVVPCLFATVFLGGAAGICLLLSGIKKRKDPVPYGPFISAGALLALFSGQEIIAWYGQFLQ